MVGRRSGGDLVDDALAGSGLTAQVEETLHRGARRRQGHGLVEVLRFGEQSVGGVGGAGEHRGLGVSNGVGWERRDPAGQAVDERVEFIGGQGPVEPTPALAGGSASRSTPPAMISIARPSRYVRAVAGWRHRRA